MARQVGDRVLVRESYGWHSCRHKPGTITRVTPSGITTVTVDAYPPHGTIAHDKVFNKHGRERGGRYGGDSLADFDQKVLEREIHEALVSSKRRMLEDFKLWSEKLSDDLILKIADIVEKELTAKP